MSIASARSLPNRRVFSSTEAGWTSILLEHHASAGASEPFEVRPTPDQTVVLALRHDHDLEISRRGRWHQTVQREGALGTSAPLETCRLRWRVRRRDRAFETAHLYIPQDAVLELRDELARAGRRPRTDRLSALSLHDGTARAGIVRLLAAAREGAPDLYAAAARHWIVANLLYRNSVADRGHRLASVPVDADRRIARAVEALAAHIETAPTLEWLAAEAGVSKFHLPRLFRRRTGRTPWQVLLDLRMDRARELLSQGDLPVAVIATRCGYQRANNFATAFTRLHGRSPTQFRRAAAR